MMRVEITGRDKLVNFARLVEEASLAACEDTAGFVVEDIAKRLSGGRRLDRTKIRITESTRRRKGDKPGGNGRDNLGRFTSGGVGGGIPGVRTGRLADKTKWTMSRVTYGYVVTPPKDRVVAALKLGIIFVTKKQHRDLQLNLAKQLRKRGLKAHA